MSDFYIEIIVDKVISGIKSGISKEQLIDEIDKMMKDDWMSITGFGDD